MGKWWTFAFASRFQPPPFRALRNFFGQESHRPTTPPESEDARTPMSKGRRSIVSYWTGWIGLHWILVRTIGQLKQVLSERCRLHMLWILPLVSNSLFSVATQGFNVVIFDENHGAEHTVMENCIASTTLYRRAREFSGMEYKTEVT